MSVSSFRRFPFAVMRWPSPGSQDSWRPEDLSMCMGEYSENDFLSQKERLQPD
jgi:hypothetical protein